MDAVRWLAHEKNINSKLHVEKCIDRQHRYREKQKEKKNEIESFRLIFFRSTSAVTRIENNPLTFFYSPAVFG